MDTTPRSSASGDVGPATAESGEAAAFWHLAESYRPYLKAVAARLLPGRLAAKLDASDVVQQALLAAFQQRDQFRGPDAEQWYQWVLAIVRNEARNLVRYFEGHKHDVGLEQPLPAGSGGERQLAASGSGPIQQAVRREQAARLLAAVQRLAPDHAQVIHLRNFEDLSYADIGARMGRSEAAVRQLWKRAIERLRDAWGED